jgi:hypothetical protein
MNCSADIPGGSDITVTGEVRRGERARVALPPALRRLIAHIRREGDR